jgi:hypothetical protein
VNGLMRSRNRTVGEQAVSFQEHVYNWHEGRRDAGGRGDLPLADGRLTAAHYGKAGREGRPSGKDKKKKRRRK